MPKITWFGHSVIQVESAAATLLIDPFLTGNPKAPVKAADVSADVILVSHGHGDHLGDTVALAKRTGATVICNFEIAGWLGKQGVAKVHPMHIGGSSRQAWGTVKLTQALHGSGLPDGSYGGNPCGFLLTVEGKKIYHACDTGLFLDMQLIGEEGLDLAILPIGDNFTMGPDDALRAVKLLKPRQVLPIHYDTFDLIRQDPAAWRVRVEKESGARVAVLQPGESLQI